MRVPYSPKTLSFETLTVMTAFSHPNDINKSAVQKRFHGCLIRHRWRIY
jgi:hypothetical protein